MNRPILRRGFSSFALFALLLAAALPAAAFVASEQNDLYEIALPEFDLTGVDNFDRAMGTQGVEAVLSARYEGQWKVHAWNPQTNTPHYAYGMAYQMASSINSASQVEELARQVIASNQEVLRADLANLRLTAVPSAMGKWAAHFQQTYNGIDVLGAKVTVLFHENGNLMLMGSDYYSDIAVNPTPGVPEASAVQLARAALPFNPATDKVEGAELLVLPYPLSETEVEHHLVWRIRVHTEDPLGIWVTHIDAHTGDILWRYNDTHFAYGGDTEADIYEYGYCDGAAITEPMPYLRIDVSGVGSVVSDEDGNWSIAGTGGNRTVSCDMEGPYCHVYDNAAGAEAFFSGTAQEDVPFTVDWDDTNSQQDERDVMEGVSEVRDFIRIFDPGFGYINQSIDARVSINDACNAFWNGSINFFREAGGCANTGEMHQVVHHEFGHGIQNFILNSQGGQGLGEGNGDIIGNLITQDSVIGRGFYLNNCTGGIRDSDNNLSYPGDVIGQEIHYAGQVIAGFNWDAMILLQDAYGGGMNWDGLGTVMSGERWHFGRVLGHPGTQPDQVLWTFIADDDNGDLGDGTPNHAIFCEAAENHGFECPEILIGVFLYHDGVPYTGDQSNDVEIVGQAVSLGGGVIDPSSVELFYRVDGGAFSSTPMSPTGNPDEYTGDIPNQPWGSVVEYYLYAENDQGENGTSPREAPMVLHYYEVGDNFPDEFEDASGWTAGASDDNASTGHWVREDPVGTAAQPEDDHTPNPGTICWVTGNANPGDGIGTNDVDGGKTTLLSPVYDLAGASDVAISYWKWFSNDQGNAPNQDYWDVDISNDGGETWTVVEHTLTNTNGWVQVSLDVDADYFANIDQLRLRFVASDEIDGSIVEAAVDDFTLAAVLGGTGTDDGMAVTFVTGMAQNVPNPFNPRTKISFSLESAGQASLRVYDASGRVVKELANGSMDAGQHEVIWNGDDARGNQVASGVYFYRLETESTSVSKRMVLLK